MRWLKDNVYVAAWLSPLITLVGYIIRTPRTATGDPDWSRIVIYVMLLTFLAAALTPQVDEGMKTTARYLMFMGLAFMIVDRKPR